ncbi:MAG: RNA polymerase sigma factor [bacterium]
MGHPPISEEACALVNQRLNQFFAGVEKRAFRMAMVSVGNREDALDVVQDAMLQLVRKYSNRPEHEWPPLFYRILHNKMMDVHRKRKVRDRFSGWIGYSRDDDEQQPDPIENSPGPAYENPEVRHRDSQTLEALEKAIGKLPPRQQQAFMLRCWEGFNTAETAATMKCTEGSVKTHYSRALNSLRAELGEYYEQ